MDESASTISRHDGFPRRRKIWLLVALIMMPGLVLFFAVLPVQVCRDWAFICENTGSHQGYRQWCTGHRSGRWRRESHLEQFMRQQHPSELENRWTSYAGTGKNILGRATSFGHDFPQWGSLMMTSGIFDRYVDTLDDAAKLDLYRRLSSGDRIAIQAEEEKIEEMALAQRWPLTNCD